MFLLTSNLQFIDGMASLNPINLFMLFSSRVLRFLPRREAGLYHAKAASFFYESLLLNLYGGSTLT